MAEETAGISTETSATDTTSLTSEVSKENQDKGQEVAKDITSKEQAGDKPADKPAAEQPVVPEKYDLKLPKDVLVDEEMMKEFSSFGKENKWTNDQAQKVADLHLKAIGAFVNKMDAEFVQTVEGWHNEVMSDKDIGGAKVDDTMAQARKVIAMASTIPGIKVDRFKADLEKTGMTTHPDFIRLCHYFGQFIGQDNKFIRGGTTASEEQDAATILYGPTGVRDRNNST